VIKNQSKFVTPPLRRAHMFPLRRADSAVSGGITACLRIFARKVTPRNSLPGGLTVSMARYCCSQVAGGPARIGKEISKVGNICALRIFVS
jgi:hypothetical protein